MLKVDTINHKLKTLFHSDEAFLNQQEGLKDVQQQKGNFEFDIQEVGISNVKLPIILKEQERLQTPLATIKLTTSLKSNERGTHMSRLIQNLELYLAKPLTLPLVKELVQQIARSLAQERVDLAIDFPWVFDTTSPVMQLTSTQHANLQLNISYDSPQTMELWVVMKIGVTTLCPCSKEISMYGAHNQRGFITMQAKVDETAMSDNWKHDLKNIALSNASAPIYNVLKREDEKFVTEEAYQNPRFVEDLARLVAADLEEVHWIKHYKVTCENEESIHLHNAIAVIESNK